MPALKYLLPCIFKSDEGGSSRTGVLVVYYMLFMWLGTHQVQAEMDKLVLWMAFQVQAASMVGRIAFSH